MKITLSEVRQMVREELYQMIDEIVSKEVPNGTSWKLAGKKGWGAKNKNGVTNYYYGEDENANKQKADAFRNDSERKKSEFLKKEARIMELSPKTLGSYIKKASGDIERSAHNQGADHAETRAVGSRPSPNDEYDKKIHKRSKGIHRATDKLVKKAGDSWTTKSGKKAKKNADGSISYEEK
jgi:hypothetical protein